MGKKKRKAFGSKKEEKEKRGFRVVDMQGKPMLLPVPGGMRKEDAERLSKQFLLPTKVIELAPDE